MPKAQLLSLNFTYESANLKFSQSFDLGPPSTAVSKIHHFAFCSCTYLQSFEVQEYNMENSRKKKTIDKICVEQQYA